MSGSDDQGGAGRREVAYRLFAAEFEDADFSYSESDEERAPNYVVTPTGGRVNRVFVVGVLTEVENASDDVLRARIVDPTGAFVVYAGQYQPDAQAFFERAEPPMFVAVTGKARTFQPDDSDVTYTSIRPENVNEVDAETRDRWTVGTTRQTLARVATMARALEMDERGEQLREALEAQGVDVGLAAGIPLAIDHYGTTAAYLTAVRDLAAGAAEVVAGERDEVSALSASPGASGEGDLAMLAALDVDASVAGESGRDVPESDQPDESATTAASDTATESTGATGAATTETTGGSASDDGSSTEADRAGGDSETAVASAGSTESNGSGTAGAASTTGSDAETADTDPTDTGSTATAATEAETVESDPVDDSGDETAQTDAEPVDTGPADAEPAGTEPVDAEPVDAGAAPDTESAADAGADTGDLEDFDPGEFELDEEERQEIEEEFGTDFQSGTEVESAGEADIDTPDPEELAEAEGGATADESGEGSPATDAEPEAAAETETDESEPADGGAADAAESADDTADEPAEDVDLEDAVMDAMRDNDGDGGASESAIVDAVTDRLGADPDDVREAIQDALMDGRCYEPDDDVYKPI